MVECIAWAIMALLGLWGVIKLVIAIEQHDHPSYYQKKNNKERY